MSEERWDAKKYVDEWPEFEPSPDNSHTLLDDPHLKAVYQLATAVSGQEEGVWDVAYGLASGVSGVGLSPGDILKGDHASGNYSAWIEGYALGLQMRYAAGAGYTPEDLKPLTGLDCDEYEVSDTDISEWLRYWRQANGGV